MLHSDAVCVSVCGHYTVCRDEGSLLRSEWHGSSFLWVLACVFVSLMPHKTKVDVVC